MSLLEEMKNRRLRQPGEKQEPSILPSMDEAAGPLPQPKKETVIDFNKAPLQRPDKDERLQARLSELIKMAENSQGMTPDQVKAISDEGDVIIDQLSPEVVKGIFES